jgi:hypothetical protein
MAPPATGAGRARLRLFKVVFVLFGVVMLSLLAALAVNIDRVWPVLFRQFNAFQVSAFVHLLILVAFCFVAVRRIPSWAFNLVFALLAGWLYVSVSAPPLGNIDGVVRQAPKNIINLPEILHNLLVHLLYRVMDLRYLSPISGFFTALAYQAACDRVFPRAAWPQRDAKLICSLTYLGAGANLLFFRDFTDSATAPSMPFPMLFVCLAARYLHGNAPKFDLNARWAALAMLAACMFHASNLFLLPALVVMIGIRRLFDRQYKLLVTELAAALVIPAAACGATLLGLSAAGFELNPASALGGGDGFWFVAMEENTLPHFYFTMFSWDHAIQTANIALLAGPAAALAAALAARSVLKAGSLKGESHYLLLATLAMGYVCFISLWGFDLGFPADIYLMLGTSLPIPLFTAGIILRLSRNVRFVLAGASLLYAWTTLFIFLR